MKEKTSSFDNSEWYNLCMQQSQLFMKSAEENLKNMFNHPSMESSEENLKQFEAWIESLKKQWQQVKLNDEQKKFQEYWSTMSSMCMEASDLMLKEWMKRAKENHPIQSITELHELWLKCCRDVYQKTMLTHTLQKNYDDMMNAAFDFWKNVRQ